MTTSSPYPTGFDLSKATECACLVNVAYQMYRNWDDRGNQLRADFDFTADSIASGYRIENLGADMTGFLGQYDISKPIWGRVFFFFELFSIEEPFAFLAKSKSTQDIYIVFRGTQSLGDWRHNIKMLQTKYEGGSGYVHRGFMRIYESLKKELLSTLDKLVAKGAAGDVYLCGHSLGGALSTLAVPDVHSLVSKRGWKVHHYSFASPNVGNPVFADAYNSFNVPSYRVLNVCDDVPFVPLPVDPLRIFLYEPIGCIVYYSAHYGDLVVNHDMDRSYLYALKNWSKPFDSKLQPKRDEAVGEVGKPTTVVSRFTRRATKLATKGLGHHGLPLQEKLALLGKRSRIVWKQRKEKKT